MTRPSAHESFEIRNTAFIAALREHTVSAWVEANPGCSVADLLGFLALEAELAKRAQVELEMQVERMSHDEATAYVNRRHRPHEGWATQERPGSLLPLAYYAGRDESPDAS